MGNGTGPVEGQNRTQGTDQGDTDNWGDYAGGDFGDTHTSESTSTSRTSTTTTTRSTYGTGSTTGATGSSSGIKYSSVGSQPTISGTGDFSTPAGDAEVTQAVQNLAQQGYTPDQIRSAVQQQYGITLTDQDIQYATQGFSGGNYRGYNKYMGSYGTMGPLSRNYGSPYFQQYIDQINMANEAKDAARAGKKASHQEMVKMHMILLQIMMGDIAGAIRSYSVLMERDNREFTRGIVKKLEAVRQARSRVIRNFANHKPPKAYAGTNPQSAARAQDQAQRFTQFVQLSTQLMGELQNTERELVDALQTARRDVDNMWQTYAQVRDLEARTTERLLRSG